MVYGASRHLVVEESLLQNAAVCDYQDGLTHPNDETLNVTTFGKVTVETLDDDEVREVTLSDVFYAPSISEDLRLISCGRLKKLGCQFFDIAANSSRIKKDGQVVFEFPMVREVCIVCTLRRDRQPKTNELLQEMVLSAIFKTGGAFQPHMGNADAISHASRHFDFDTIDRMAIAFDTIELMAKESDSCIKITCHMLSKCVIYSQEKGTRTARRKKD